jgi:hypothetical protein
MYRLKKVQNGMFQIHSKKHSNAYEGTPKSIFKMCMEMGIEEHELFYALGEMDQKEHDYAEFGVWGRFILSGKTPQKGGLCDN